MKFFVFTVVAIILFSFSPSGKANAFDWDCWNTIQSWFLTPDVLCDKCTVNQICISEGWGGWKCTTFGYAGCRFVRSSNFFSPYRELKCTKPHIDVFYKSEEITYRYQNKISISLLG